MPGLPRPVRWVSWPPLFALLVAGFLGCAASGPRAPQIVSAPIAPPSPGGKTGAGPTAQRPAATYPVMLGIDVLEARNFAPVQGKRIGLLTHPAGVNRRGESTIDVLRRAPGVTLVSLYGPEHGIYGNEKAEIPIEDNIDARTGLPVYSLYGTHRKPTPAMLKGLDALVIDLQDVGTRSYTFISSMLYAMAACFENNIEGIVLDRPNPLGGLKVDGPPLDAKWKSYVGAFRVPYVHGLTIGELARMAKDAPGVMTVPNAIDVPDEIRVRGRLTVVPMQGWRRDMRWPETGLKWIPTSPYVPDFAAVVGYPMTGLGTYIGGFSHGFPGPLYPFRGLSHRGTPIEVIEREINARRIPGITLRRINVPNRAGKPVPGLYIEITDWNAWNPTELNFHLMQLACKFERANPFAEAPNGTVNGFIKHVGSEAFFDALKRDGVRIDLPSWLARWQQGATIYQQQSRRYWLYN